MLVLLYFFEQSPWEQTTEIQNFWCFISMNTANWNLQIVADTTIDGWLVCNACDFIFQNGWNTNDANGSKHMISQNEPQYTRFDSSSFLFFSCISFRFVREQITCALFYSRRVIRGIAHNLTDKTNNINLFKFMANHKSSEIFFNFYVLSVNRAKRECERTKYERRTRLEHTLAHTHAYSVEKVHLKCTSWTICISVF